MENSEGDGGEYTRGYIQICMCRGHPDLQASEIFWQATHQMVEGVSWASYPSSGAWEGSYQHDSPREPSSPAVACPSAPD